MRASVIGHRCQCRNAVGGSSTTLGTQPQFEHLLQSFRNNWKSCSLVCNTNNRRPKRCHQSRRFSAPQVSAKAQSAPQSGFWPAYQPPGAQSSSESDSTDEDDVGTTDENDMSADDLKSILLDSLYGTDRGLSASSEVRSEISELLTQLEAKNPTPAPTEAIDKLSGKWKLVYTASSELTGLLGLNRVPGVEVGDITQTINAYTLSALNTVSIQGFGSRTSVSAKAALEVQSPKRVQVRFERTIIESPELVTDAELPSYVSLLGQPVDLTQLKSSLAPVTAYAQEKAVRLSAFLQRQPNLDIAIPGNKGAQSWLLTTYLDDELRISRGDNGAIFVLVKDSFVTPELM